MLVCNALPISTYCEMYHDTTKAIDQRIAKKIWAIGKQVVKPQGCKERWINIKEVEKWALKNSQVG